MDIVTRFREISHIFSNGTVVINATTHFINFESPEKLPITIHSSMLCHENPGWAVIRTTIKKVQLYTDQYTIQHLKETRSEDIIKKLSLLAKTIYPDVERIRIIGDEACADLYQGVYSVIPIAETERLSPDKVKMSTTAFNVGLAY